MVTHAARRRRFESTIAEEVEDYAHEAYAYAGQDPAYPRGPLRMLRHPSMAGRENVQLVDAGVAPCVPVFECRERGLQSCRVHILADQPVSGLAMACARACAQIVIARLGNTRSEAFVYALTLAILMPIPAIEDDAAGMSLGELAHKYCAEPEEVAARLRMLRRGSVSAADSGDRPAIDDGNEDVNSGLFPVGRDDRTPSGMHPFKHKTTGRK